MQANNVDFTNSGCNPNHLKQGATFSYEILWTKQNLITSTIYDPVDLTGFTAKMQLRFKENDPLIFELSNANGRIILGGITGKINLLINATDSSTILKGKYKYDLKMTSPSGFVTYLIEGVFEVVEEITQ